MGSCQSKTSTRVAPTTTTTSVNDRTFLCSVMISYCWEDRVLCHQLATHLIKDGFQVSIDRDRIHNRFDKIVTREIDDNDIILLCISEAYTNDYYCQKEARYASDEHKTIIVVWVTSNYVAQGWISFIISYKPLFKLTGSRSDFQKGYKPLIKTLHRHVTVDPSMRTIPRRIVPAKEIEKRRAAYEEALKQQIVRDQPKVSEVKQHVDQLWESIENQPDDEDSKTLAGMDSLKDWKENYPQMTSSKVVPFTITGDINDAAFNVPPAAAYRLSRFHSVSGRR